MEFNFIKNFSKPFFNKIIVASLIIIIIILALIYFLYPAKIKNNWSVIQDDYANKIKNEVKFLFEEYQQKTADIVIGIADSPELFALVKDTQKDRTP